MHIEFNIIPFTKEDDKIKILSTISMMYGSPPLVLPRSQLGDTVSGL